MLASWTKRVAVAYAALLLVGLIAGAGISSILYQAQMSSLQSQLSQLRSDLEKTKPQLPASASVTLDLKTSVLLLLDFTTSICYRRASCNATISAVQALMAKARSAGVPILYTHQPVQELANQTGDMVITNDRGADKFYATDLENWLRGKSIKTVVIAGVAANGAVLYTSFEATLRGFTVVVPADCIASDNDYIQTYTLFQLLNQPGRSNPQNKPLVSSAITLSSANQITFG